MIDLNNLSKQKWTNTKISILGAGKSGIAAAKLCNYIQAKPFISDNNISDTLKENLNSFNYELNGHTNEVLDSELIIKSPGINSNIPIIQKCIKNGLPIVSEIEFASWFTNTPIIAVTGSNGKSTTVNLIKKMFDVSKIHSQIGANFGTPFSELVLFEKKNPNKNKLNILEVSSFQLENIFHFSPNYSIILNISPDHLDRHGSIENYLKQKLKITKNLREPGWLIFNSGDILLSNQLHDYERNIPFSQSYSNQALLSLNKTKIYYQNSKDVLIYLNDLGIQGFHNIDNVLAASTLAIKFGLKHNAICKALKDIKPLEHRMELIKKINGIDFFNDSKATNIESTIAAIKSFKKNIILILGGRDKGTSDFNKLLNFSKSKIKLIITYGESGEKIKAHLDKKYTVNFYFNFKDAITNSINQANEGDTVLLSPSCSSFDQFDNYEDRGNYFKKIILNKFNSC